MRADTDTGSRERILFLLKTRGAQTAARLARRLDITIVAVRQHLQRLQEGELVTFDEQRGSVGRPARIWRLTEKAAERFPEGYTDLAVDMLDALRATFGERGLAKMLEARRTTQVEHYREVLPGEEQSLSRRVAALARLRSDEGYMAESSRLRDGSVVLVENHCPIYAAATLCQGLCGAELELFHEAIGSDVTVEREEHILAGDRRCTYRFRPAATT